MRIKIALFVILSIIGISAAARAQSRDAGTVGESSSTGVWPSVDSGSSSGYDSGNHGNVN